MVRAANILPIDGEGGPRRSLGSEGVNPGVRLFKHLAPTPSTIKGEDGNCAEAAS